MKMIFADFNAMTEEEHVCLTTIGSQKDIEQAGLEPGDWAWLTDGEILVGARLAIDDYYGLVGVPAWETLVHFDDEEANDDNFVQGELNRLLLSGSTSVEDEPLVFQRLTQRERIASEESRAQKLGDWAMRRAFALREMGQPELALLEIEVARTVRPNDPDVKLFYLELLRTQDLPRAARESEELVRDSDLSPVVLSVCITVLATLAEEAPEDRFRPIATKVFEWSDRLFGNPDFEDLLPSLRAMTHFNRGAMLLRLGRTTEAREAFGEAHELYPHPIYGEAMQLDAFDERARQLAQRHNEQLIPIAA